MGATQSQQSVESLKNKLLSLALVTSAEDIHPKVVYRNVEIGTITNGDSLPLVSTTNVANLSATERLNLYTQYYNDETAEHIEQFLIKHVLASPEQQERFLQRFHQRLIGVQHHEEPVASVRSQPRQEVQSLRSQGGKTRGAKRLDKRMDEMMKAIDHEQHLNAMLQQNTETATAVNEDIQSTVGPKSLLLGLGDQK